MPRAPGGLEVRSPCIQQISRAAVAIASYGGDQNWCLELRIRRPSRHSLARGFSTCATSEQPSLETESTRSITNVLPRVVSTPARLSLSGGGAMLRKLWRHSRLCLLRETEPVYGQTRCA